MNKILEKFSLRARLGLLYAVLLISSVVLVSYYSYWNIWQLFINSKTSHLRARAKPIIDHWLVDQGLTNPDSVQMNFTHQSALVLSRDLTSRDAVAIVLNRQGEVIANGRRLPEEPVAPAPDTRYFRKALSGMNEITYWSEVNGKPVLVFLIPLRPQPGSRHIFGVIQVSTSLADINEILFRHGSMQITAVAIILMLGIAFGYWLIGLSLKDLQNLSATCREIAKGDFAKRTKVKNRKDEIGKLAESFNLMIDKLENMFNSQKRFVANAAHELLTPLTGLRGSLEVLLRGAQDDPEATNRLSKGMYKEVKRLIRVCDQLLGLSRLENSSNVGKRRIVLNEFIKDFEQRGKLLAQGRQIVIQEGPLLTLMADPDLLEQILFNLLSNAVRYSPAGTPVILGWKLIADYVEIWISDRGKGMDNKTLAHVFEPFYRGKNENVTGEKGAGLGLALTKSMVEAQGGTIRIESTPGNGTTVFFTLPL
ncbi:MAG: HAMP domain-containing histidine kinase [Calditrichaeota bacterium]|nr:HAMP domain-containing histidine kinase [Calditrichota bacterium]